MKTHLSFGVLFAVLLSSNMAFAQVCSPADVFVNRPQIFGYQANPMMPQAVTEALDFTKTDCGGVEHHFFSELEAGNVILLQFSMNCPSCENARNILEDVEAQFADSHPGRFHIYTMSYTNSTTCDKMKLWSVVKNHENPVFLGVADQMDYYGGFGMPTIVIAGGKEHKVYYVNANGIHDADAELTKIKNAISEALSTSSVEVADLSDAPFLVYPNPAHDQITLSLSSVLPMQFGAHSEAEIRIVNHIGAQVLQQTVKAYDDITFDIGALAPGVYRLSLTRQDNPQKTAVFIKY